jgi:hypothetical protein
VISERSMFVLLDTTNNKSLFCIVCRTINTILYCKQDNMEELVEISFKLSLTSTDFVSLGVN